MSSNPAPLVSVYIPTYYHEKYISQAIESVLAQKTNFEYEIIITDDASKDKTPEIIQEYANQYNNIRCFINKKNIGLSNNMLLGKQLCTGKYIIELSGDDYWIDDFKLQKQVDFLEKHPEFIAVCTRIEARADNEVKPLMILPDLKLCEKKFTKDMFLKGINLPLNGIMIRNVMLDDKSRRLFEAMPSISPYIDDLTDNLFILMTGDAYILKDVTVAYRTRRKIKTDRNFNSMNKGLQFFERHIDLLNNLDEYLNHSEDLFHRYKMVVLSGFIQSVSMKQFDKFYKKYKSIPEHYRKRHLALSCIGMVPSKTINKLVRGRIRIE